MAIFFSKETMGFYLTEFHTVDEIPTDAVEITPEYYEDIIQKHNSENLIITSDDNGYPILTTPEYSDLELAESVRYGRNNLLKKSEYLISRHKEQLEAEIPTTITSEDYMNLLHYRQNLRDITRQLNFPREVEWPKLIIDNIEVDFII
jgi:hypothetical protein